MRTPESLSHAFGQPFQDLMVEVAVSEGLLPSALDLQSKRFLNRSILPHLKKLSELFNRLGDSKPGDASYWQDTSNRENLRLSYYLMYMPVNLFRVASVFSELARLGFQWPEMENLRAIELGAGPASGATGVAAATRWAQFPMPATTSWALVEQDGGTLKLGTKWAEQYFASLGLENWTTREFKRQIDLQEILPRSAPRFHLWVMSYFLNESKQSAEEIASGLLQGWHKHLEKEGLVVIVEPALKEQSRRLLELRKALIANPEFKGYQVLLPCMGHQACGALANPDDWCHEEVTWKRPEILRRLDEIAGLDHRSLPFSYLVIAKSARPRAEILPETAGTANRLVSPAFYQGSHTQEFYICGETGKRRARLNQGPHLHRGNILVNLERDPERVDRSMEIYSKAEKVIE